MSNILDKNAQLRTWVTAATYVYAADDSKGAGQKDARILMSELLGLGGKAGQIPHVASNGYYQVGDSGLYFDATNEYVSIGLTDDPPTPRNTLHLHKASGAEVGIKFTNTDLGTAIGSGHDIGGSSDGLRYNAATGTTHRWQVNNVTTATVSSGGLAVGTSGINASAILELSSTSKGMLIPRLTTTERNNISSPASSLLIYNTDETEFQFYNGSSWTSLGGGASSDSLTATTYSTDIDLTINRNYNTKLAPVTDSAINFNITSAKSGVTGFIIYQAASKPTITLDGSTTNVDILNDSFVANSIVTIWYSYYVDTDGLKSLFINYIATNQAPTASGITANSTYLVDNDITVSFTYQDNENDSPGDHDIVFVYADDIFGLYETQFATGIGNNASAVIPSAADGKFIGVKVTPVAQTGASPGLQVTQYFDTQVSTGSSFTNVDVQANYTINADVGAISSIVDFTLSDGSAATTLYDVGDSIDIAFTDSVSSNNDLEVLIRSGDAGGTGTKFNDYSFEFSSDGGSNFSPITGSNGTIVKENLTDIGTSSWGYKTFSNLTFGTNNVLRVTAAGSYAAVNDILRHT